MFWKGVVNLVVTAGVQKLQDMIFFIIGNTLGHKEFGHGVSCHYYDTLWFGCSFH